MLQTRHQAVKRISALSDAEVPLNFTALTGFKPLLINLFLVKDRVCRFSSQFWAVQMDPQTVAVPNILARSEDRVRKDSLGIITMSLPR